MQPLLVAAMALHLAAFADGSALAVAADGDGDGLADDVEPALCLDPADSDTDGDGALDGSDDTVCFVRGYDGLADWKVFQRGPGDSARIPLVLRYRSGAGRRVEVRLAGSDGGGVLAGHDFADHAWPVPAEGSPGGALLRTDAAGVPAGGNYDVDARLVDADTGAVLARDRVDAVAVGDVFLAAGQSNMSGWRPLFEPFDPKLPDPRVHLFGNDYVWKPGTEPMDSPTGALDAVSNARDGWAAHSPTLAFAKAIAATTAVPVGIVPASQGGSSLAAWQRPAGDPRDRTTLYGSAVHRVLVQGYEHAIRGVLWYQGETEAMLRERPDAYRAGLERFVADLRADLGDPRLPFASCQLAALVGHDDATLASWVGIQGAQWTHAASDAATVLVPLLDVETDGVHLTIPGHKDAGRRLGRAVLAAFYAAPVPGPPRLLAVRRADAGRVELRYDRAMVGGAASLYRARYLGLDLQIDGVEVGGAVVTLHVAVPLRLPTTLTYGFGRGHAADWLVAGDGSGAAHAFAATVHIDQPIAGTALEMRDLEGTPSRRSLRFTSRDPVVGATDANPTVLGARLHVFNGAGGGDSACFVLPAALWRARGSGYVYRDPRHGASAVTKVRLRGGRGLQVAADGCRLPLPYSLDEPLQSAVVVALHVGETTYCARFGGTVVEDRCVSEWPGSVVRFVARDAAAPAWCPDPPATCP